MRAFKCVGTRSNQHSNHLPSRRWAQRNLNSANECNPHGPRPFLQTLQWKHRRQRKSTANEKKKCKANSLTYTALKRNGTENDINNEFNDST